MGQLRNMRRKEEEKIEETELVKSQGIAMKISRGQWDIEYVTLLRNKTEFCNMFT